MKPESEEDFTQSPVSISGLGALMLDIKGLELSKKEEKLIGNPQVGGIILFSRNYKNREQLVRLVGQIRKKRPDILLAVDQEGGRVQRFRDGFTRLPAMQVFCSLYHDNPEPTLELVQDTGWLMAAELISAGIDLSFAPVLDVDDDYCSVIADRSFSSQAEEVAVLAERFINGMHEAGMAATGKHFPGHGSVREDSHLALPVDNRTMDQIESKDMQPFLTLKTKLDALMPAHICFPAVDAYPVGFSKLWLQKVVRSKLGFSGILFSDDLTMAATESYGDYSQRAELALNAGCDMVLVCNNPKGAQSVLKYLGDNKRLLSQKINTLRAKKMWNYDFLGKSERWQYTRDRLQAIVKS